MVSLAIASMARALDSGLIVIEAVVGAGGIICAGRIKRMRLEGLEGAGGSLLIGGVRIKRRRERRGCSSRSSLNGVDVVGSCNSWSSSSTNSVIG